MTDTVNLVTPPSSPSDRDDVVFHQKIPRDSTGSDPVYYGDDPVEMPPQPKKQRVEAMAAMSNSAGGDSAGDDDDDDCVITGSSGLHPLVDFAHGRWNCCKVPINTHPVRSFCQNCYCVICDMPANQCQAWAEHCDANPTDPEVREKRAVFQKKNAHLANNCHLNQLTQIYPTEVDVEVNDVTLKTYQRQVIISA